MQPLDEIIRLLREIHDEFETLEDKLTKKEKEAQHEQLDRHSQDVQHHPS